MAEMDTAPPSYKSPDTAPPTVGERTENDVERGAAGGEDEEYDGCTGCSCIMWHWLTEDSVATSIWLFVVASAVFLATVGILGSEAPEKLCGGAGELALFVATHGETPP